MRYSTNNKQTKGSGLLLALSVLGIGVAAPAFGALTAPALELTDSLGDSITIDSSGSAATCAGNVTCSSYSVASGSITWSGTIGPFTVIGLNGRTKPALFYFATPTLDIGVTQISTAGTGGVLTIKWSDTGFDGEGQMTVNPGASITGTGSAQYTGYADTSNVLFGTGIVVGTSTGAVVTGAGPSAQPFSMTLTEVITLGANTTFNNDLQLLGTAPPPLTLACSSPSGQAGVPYSSSLVASGGNPSYTYQILSGSLPTGLTLNMSSGLISGTTNTTGNFNFVAQVTDALGHTATTATASSPNGCGLTISPPLTPLSLSCSASTGTVGTAYNSSLVASGGVMPYKLFQIVPSGGLPPGLFLNGATGAISGTPTGVGTFSFTAEVTDSNSNSAVSMASASCKITTSDCNPLTRGDAATIGFWHNKNGQALIDSLNGSSSSTALANWLAMNFSYLYGSQSSHNVSGESNTAIAALDLTYFGQSGQKTSAQILGGALACYVTSSTLSGTTAVPYGFNSSPGGTCFKTFNVGSDGTAIGLSNNQSYTILQLLQQINLTIKNGKYDANAANDIFSNINQGGDIN